MGIDETAVRRRANTRARLLEAAEVLFREHGSTAAVGIDAICRQAGFTRGAFYSNFRSVDDVFFAVYEEQTEALLERLATATPIPSRATAVDEIVGALLATLPADTGWYAIRAQFAAQSRSRPDIAAALREHGDRLREGVQPFIAAAARSMGRELRWSLPESTSVLIAAHVGAVLQGPLVDDPEQLRRDVLLTAFLGATGVPAAADPGPAGGCAPDEPTTHHRDAAEENERA